MDDSEIMIAAVKRRVDKVIEVIRDQEKAEVRRTEILKKRVEQEIAELKRRDAELEQLCHIDGDIHFLKVTQHLFLKAFVRPMCIFTTVLQFRNVTNIT